MALTLTIGAGPIAKVQSGPVLGGSVLSGTLAAPSTAGSCLLFLGANDHRLSITSMPAGWVQLIHNFLVADAQIEAWAYLNNPGGIASVTPIFPGASNWWGHLSEWANVAAVAALETSGQAGATSGTTLAPVTAGNVVSTGDVAISAWLQQATAVGAVTFTTPAGFTRLADNGSDAAVASHLDAEYQLNPATGAPLGPTLTSSVTTLSAGGVIVVLKAAPQSADQSAYLAYGSLSVKLNTLDFALIDCPVAIPNFASVTLSSPGEYPDWTGNVGQVTAVDLVDRATGHNMQVIAATNTQTPNFTGSPFDLSDNPAADTTTLFQLEDGSGNILLENGTGSYLTEGTLEYSYQGLSFGTQVGAVNPVTYTTIGYVTVFQVGMWPGMTFKLTSSNLSKWILAPGSLYTIQTVTITYQGANPPTPAYQVQFGDRIQTLAEWTLLH